MGEALAGLPACAGKSWRVENQSAKSTFQIAREGQFLQNIIQKKLPDRNQIHHQTKQSQSTVHFFRASTRCYTDEQVAFVISHEISHHALGHVNLFAGWAPRLTKLAGVTLFAFAVHALERHLYGPKTECDADPARTTNLPTMRRGQPKPRFGCGSRAGDTCRFVTATRCFANIW